VAARPPSAASGADDLCAASGANVPTNVTISCITTGAVIFYTLDGSPADAKFDGLYGAVSLGVGQPRCEQFGFTNGWRHTPWGGVGLILRCARRHTSGLSKSHADGEHNMPTAPMVTFSVTPGSNAACVAVTEIAAFGMGATNATAGGNYIASNNVVVWDHSRNECSDIELSAIGQPGNYPVQAIWSVDGVGGSEFSGTNIVVASVSAVVCRHTAASGNANISRLSVAALCRRT